MSERDDPVYAFVPLASSGKPVRGSQPYSRVTTARQVSMSNRMLTLMMGFVAFLILAVGVVFVIGLAGGGGDDDGGGSAPADRDRTPGASTSGKICDGKTLIVPGDDPSSVLGAVWFGAVRVRKRGHRRHLRVHRPAGARGGEPWPVSQAPSPSQELPRSRRSAARDASGRCATCSARRSR